MAILVTGGAGYIGSHTVVELQNAGYDVVVVDNLCNSSEKALDRVSKITGKPVKFYKADILDRDAMNEVFDKEEIDSCIHFAGLKAVGESVAKPWEYYENNIAGTLTLVDVMRKHNVKNIISLPQRPYTEIRQSSRSQRSARRDSAPTIWLDEIHAGADPYRYPEGRSGVECSSSSLLQPDRCS